MVVVDVMRKLVNGMVERLLVVKQNGAGKSTVRNI
jgi:ABC-type branched-subunit amino acid transport system ATPase component